MREKVLQLAVSTMVYKIKVTGTEYNQVWWGLAAEVSGVTSYWGFQIWTKKTIFFFFFFTIYLFLWNVSTQKLISWIYYEFNCVLSEL